VLAPLSPVTYRIDCSTGAGGLAVRVSGQLDAAGAGELRELCRDRSGALILDLEELVAADAASLAALRALREEGGRLIGASHYIRLLLDGDAGR